MNAERWSDNRYTKRRQGKTFDKIPTGGQFHFFMLLINYKIGSACIVNRVKTVLPSLVNEDQKGFIANRFVGDNIRVIYDLG